MTEIAKVSLVGKTDHWLALGNTACTWANQKKDGSWVLLYKPTTCRSYLQCHWWQTTHEPEYKVSLCNKSSLTPERDRTCIFISFKGLERLRVDAAIKFLHDIEDEAGIPHTTFLMAGGSADVVRTLAGREEPPMPIEGVIFIGDKAWSSTLWKISLYSLLICKVVSRVLSTDYREGYYDAFLAHKKQFLAKVKDCNEEVIQCSTDYMQVHAYSGFVSIASGENLAMAKILEIAK